VYASKWYYANKERALAKDKAWKAKNRTTQARKPERERERVRYKQRREALAGRPQAERCEICNRAPTGHTKATHFDHCHTTGKFRGWLCTKCNTALGLADEDPKILRAIADYIERFRAP
jgi:hypothetical protein